jgi:hypothetical protein
MKASKFSDAQKAFILKQCTLADAREKMEDWRWVPEQFWSATRFCWRSLWRLTLEDHIAGIFAMAANATAPLDESDASVKVTKLVAGARNTFGRLCGIDGLVPRSMNSFVLP